VDRAGEFQAGDDSGGCGGASRSAGSAAVVLAQARAPGELVVPPAAPSEGGFAAVEVESAGAPAHVGSVSIEARGVTVRLDGDVSTVRITAIASALRAIR